MAHVAKILELVGSSETSWQGAAEAALMEAAKTIRHITGVEVTNWTAQVEGDRIVMYKAALKIAFAIEEDRPA